jgi:putative effector of murein hydrolase
VRLENVWRIGTVAYAFVGLNTSEVRLLAVVLQKRILAFDPAAPASVLARKVTSQPATEISRAFGQTFAALAAMVVFSTIPVLVLHTGLRRDQTPSTSATEHQQNLDISASEV